LFSFTANLPVQGNGGIHEFLEFFFFHWVLYSCRRSVRASGPADVRREAFTPRFFWNRPNRSRMFSSFLQ
jgi:hypothetical protein